MPEQHNGSFLTAEKQGQGGQYAAKNCTLVLDHQLSYSAGFRLDGA